MPLTNAALPVLAAAIIGEAGTYFNEANAHIGVGSGVTAFDKAQADLVGAQKTRLPMDAGYPTRAGAVLTFRGRAGNLEANHDWKEVAIFNDDTAGTMLTRFLSDKGTKVADTWVLTVEVTVTNP